MRKTAVLAGLFLCAAIFLATKSTAHAESVSVIIPANTTSKHLSAETVIEVVNAQNEQKEAEAQKAQQEEYVIANGDTLTTIANKYQTTWQRMYAKNVHIADPNVITAGVKLVVPKADEQLAERPVPVQQAPVSTTKAVSRATAATKAVVTSAPRGSSGGNTYSRGYCTWYAKNRRPDLPNNLGNANTWVSRASAQGIPTGSAPQAGAIGQQGNHVVYVERVNGDGTVTVSEMNYAGFGVVSSRTVPASYFRYIY